MPTASPLSTEDLWFDDLLQVDISVVAANHHPVWCPEARCIKLPSERTRACPLLLGMPLSIAPFLCSWFFLPMHTPEWPLASSTAAVHDQLLCLTFNLGDGDPPLLSTLWEPLTLQGDTPTSHSSFVVTWSPHKPPLLLRGEIIGDALGSLQGVVTE